MDCERFREPMLDALQGKASTELDEHVRACPACARELESLHKTSALLDQWPAPEVTPYFDSRLRARLREQAAAAAGWREWLRRPALAAAFVLVAALGVGLLDLGRPRTEVLQGPVAVRQQPKANPGTAVADLQTLDQNRDLYADFDLLDELPVEQENP